MAIEYATWVQLDGIISVIKRRDDREEIFNDIGVGECWIGL